MSKLLKSWKFFSLGLLTAALGMMLASCAEETPSADSTVDTDTTQTPPVTYTVAVDFKDIETGATLTGVSGSSSSGAGTYEAGQTVTLRAGSKSGYAFSSWTSDTVSNVLPPAGVPNPTTTFTMPARNVRITGWYEESDLPPTYYDGEAQVRLSWPDSARRAGYDILVSASVTDVEYWVEEVYGSDDYVLDDATDFPRNDGNPSLPNNFYKSAEHAQTVVNKSKYFDTDAGSYTAVCSVEDQYGIFDFVANYTITVNPATATADGADKWFEVVFDIIDYIEYYNTDEGGPDDTGVFLDDYDNPNTPPRLVKAPAKKPIKRYTSKKVTNAGTIDITYYVLHRTRK